MKLYYGISFCAHELEMNYLCNERVEKLGQRTPINFSWFVRSKPGNVCSTRLPNISLYSGPHTCIGHIGRKCQSEMYLQYLATLVIYIHLPSLLLFIPQHKDSFGISQGNANSPKPSLKLQLALPTSSMHLTALKFKKKKSSLICTIAYIYWGFFFFLFDLFSWRNHLWLQHPISLPSQEYICDINLHLFLHPSVVQTQEKAR